MAKTAAFAMVCCRAKKRCLLGCIPTYFPQESWTGAQAYAQPGRCSKQPYQLRLMSSCQSQNFVRLHAQLQRLIPLTFLFLGHLILPRSQWREWPTCLSRRRYTKVYSITCSSLGPICKYIAQMLQRSSDHRAHLTLIHGSVQVSFALVNTCLWN